MQRRVIVTADDFGLSPEVNEAVERAHREGVEFFRFLRERAQSAQKAAA